MPAHQINNSLVSKETITKAETRESQTDNGQWRGRHENCSFDSWEIKLQGHSNMKTDLASVITFFARGNV